MKTAICHSFEDLLTLSSKAYFIQKDQNLQQFINKSPKTSKFEIHLDY